ncbi:MAG: Tol-Pal system beta propeller repeat protein TolB [Alphaproteobacteria bacterium]
MNAIKAWFYTRLCAIAISALLLPTLAAKAEVTIDITRGNVQPLPIALVNFNTNDAQLQEVGAQIRSVIESNLQRSGLFAPINQQAFISSNIDIEVRPNFADWRLINAQALINGRVQAGQDGTLRVEFRLWDVFAEAQMLGFAYSTEINNWRRIAHIISDAIYKRITGESGYFDSRIIYIAESGPPKNRKKQLALMDQDGANHKFLTDGSTLVLTPRFSPISQEITYLSYFNNAPRVYLFNIQTGKQEVLGAFKGMSFAPRFSPDGKDVVMSYAKGNSTNIYALNLATRQTVQLTNNGAIDTAPSYAPDGNQITFESDRGGTQQLYVMNRDGSNQRRISFGDGRYGTPVWSPRGDLIAFTKMLAGKFYIGVMRPDGTGERLLVEGYHNEGPTWSPNGRVILFFRETPQPDGSKTSHIMSVDLTGMNERRIITPIDGSDPAWGPLNP